MVRVFTSSAVDRGFIIISMRVNPIGGVMVRVFTSSAVDRGFIIISMRVNPIGGVMVRVFTSSAGRSWVYHHFYES